MVKYKNLLLLTVGIALTLLLLTFEIFQNLIVSMGDFGYLGAFIAGIFFVSAFTVTPAGISLFLLGNELNPLVLSIIAGFGAALGDLIIFKFLKDDLYKEISSFASEAFQKKYIDKIVQSKIFTNFLPVLGALIIALPIPDEIGIAMMGLTKIETWKLFFLNFVLNTVGIFAVVSSATLFK